MLAECVTSLIEQLDPCSVMHRPILPDSLEGNILHGLDVLVCIFENVLSLRFHNDDCEFA